MGASGSVSGSTEGATSAGALVSGSVAGGVGGGAGSSGGRASITGGMLSGSISHRQVTYIPKPGEDPQSLARSLVWRAGGATKRKSTPMSSNLRSRKYCFALLRNTSSYSK